MVRRACLRRRRINLWLMPVGRLTMSERLALRKLEGAPIMAQG